MSSTRVRGRTHPERWLALLRVVVGLWFVQGALTKLEVTLASDVIPLLTPSARWVSSVPGRVAEFASGHPVAWYQAFLEHVVIPNPALFAALVAYAEAAIGAGLVLGFLTRGASLVGLFLSLNYLFARGWMGAEEMGFHIFLAVSMIAFFGADAGRTWGLDSWLQSWASGHRRERRLALAPSPDQLVWRRRG